MASFSPLQSLLGGALIGLAAVLLLALNGRIAGATGILAGLLPPAARDRAWRLAFLAGMIAAPLAYRAITGAMPPLTSDASNLALVIGGVVVGIGVTYGNGCPSGHGVCGLARLSPRSLVAVATFMATAAATVCVVRHVIGS